MVKTIKLEIQNLSNKQKEDLYKHFKYFKDKCLKDLENEFHREIDPNQEWEKSKNYAVLDGILEEYFVEYPDDFIKFQKDYENSLYNQTIKKHGFKSLTYKDILENLNKEQKKSIIWKNINELLFKFSSNSVFNKNTNLFNDGFSLWHIQENKKQAKSLQRITLHDWEWKQEFIGLPTAFNSKELVKDYQNNQYFLAKQEEKDEETKVNTIIKFFKDEDELIVFFLEQPKIAPTLLGRLQKTLNPNYQINQLIIKNLNA